MKQSKALAILKSGRNVFLTGSAGAGKTYILNQYIYYLKSHKVGVAITASTGIAATHMNGQTIHSWAGIGIKNEITPKQLSHLREKKYFREKMENVKVLIIDEISMLHRNQLDLVNRVLKFFKENELAFGGIQVVFSGDFFQLPPIDSESDRSREKFAFMADAWLESDPVICYLSEQHRQSENELNKILNEIRNGELTDSSINLLVGRIQTHFEDEISETRLFTHNADVEQVNQMFLEQIGKPVKKFKSQVKGNPNLIEVLKKSVLAPEILEVKTGAKVMFIKNNYELGYVNGTLGKVIAYSDKGYPIIETKVGDEIEAKTETWSIEDETGKVLASYVQIPLRLAWAITVHKSQGMTLDSATIDLSKAFEKGQGYVALSRLRDLNGLKLKGLNQTALEVDELAKKADKRFRELSEEWDESLDEKDLNQEFQSFILYSGGKLEPKKKGQEAKKSTYDITKEWVEKGLPIEEILEIRGFTRSTLFNHLQNIADHDPHVNLDLYKPSDETIKLVKKQVENMGASETIKLKEIYEGLQQKLTYEEIKEALLFIPHNHHSTIK